VKERQNLQYITEKLSFLTALKRLLSSGFPHFTPKQSSMGIVYKTKGKNSCLENKFRLYL